MNMQNQKGISLVMALIMLVVLSMIAVSATYSTTSSLRIVGNMQTSDEAQAAAQQMIENELSSLANFTNAPSASTTVQSVTSGTGTYTVAVAPPVCLSSAPASTGSIGMAGIGTVVNTNPNDTYWEINATASDTNSGASITVTQGVKMTIYGAQGC